MSKNNSEHNQKKLEILQTYANLVESGILFPSRKQLQSAGITRDSFRHHFSTIANLRKKAKELFPASFAGNIDIDYYVSDEYLNKIKSEVKKHKRFIFTTAVSGQNTHPGFIASLKNYAKKNKAKIFLLPSHDPAHNLDNNIEWFFDNNLKDLDILFEETRLNSNIYVSGMRVTAKQINPITGLGELSQVKGSFILASPKQFLEYDAVGANRLPHARMTTGACTLPNYSSSRGNSLRTSDLAEFQHTIGGIIVEIEDDSVYHFRQIQGDKDGSFCDLGFKYSASKITREVPVLVMGDYHAGEHDDTAVNAWIEAIDSMGIQEVVFHDLFSALSINPHSRDDIMLRSEQAERGLNSLKTELEVTSIELDRILSRKSIKKGVVVKSNHDDMLDRWLKKGYFVQDPINFRIGCSLASLLVGTKKDYLKEAVELIKKPKHFNKITWLSVDEDYQVAGVHLGAHGDKGPNGSKGSIKSLAKAYPRCIVGHSHTPGIFKGAFQVGTTSLLRLGYNQSASSWLHCSCLLYSNGNRQLISSINGKWKLKK